MRHCEVICDRDHNGRRIRHYRSHWLVRVCAAIAGHGLLCVDDEGEGPFPKIIGVGIVMVSVLSSVLLFDRLRVYDIVIDGLLIYFVFFQKTNK